MACGPARGKARRSDRVGIPAQGARPQPRYREDVREEVARPPPGGQAPAQHRLVLERHLRAFDLQARLAVPYGVGRLRLRLSAEAQRRPRAAMKGFSARTGYSSERSSCPWE